MEESVLVMQKVQNNLANIKCISLIEAYYNNFGKVTPSLQFLQKHFQFTYTTKSTFRKGSQTYNGEVFYQTQQKLKDRFNTAVNSQTIYFDGIIYGKSYNDFQVIVWKMRFGSITSKWYVISTIHNNKFTRNQFFQQGFQDSKFSNFDDEWYKEQQLQNCKMWIQKVDKIFEWLHASGRLLTPAPLQ